MEDPANSTINLRIASKTDLADVLRLYAQPDLDNGQVLSPVEAEQVFDRMAGYPDYKLYVASIDARIVGTFALLIMDNLGHLGSPSAIIEDVAVDPTCQGQGIGKEMMRHAMQIAARSGCYKVVFSSNLKRERAHAFYDSLGFERHGYSFRVEQESVRPGPEKRRD